MRYIVPFIPFIIICVIGFIGMLISAIKEDRKQREAERRRAEKAEAAARIKAGREAKKAEAAAARAAEAAQTPKRKRGRPRKVQSAPVVDPALVQDAPAPDPVRPETVSAAPFKGNNMFAGQIVAFTGTLKDMTRAEAIKAVEANGGKAFDTMPAGTTILVVGDKPGMGKLDKADKWIGQTRKITQEQFRYMLAAPLTVTPEEFADAFAS